MGVPPGTTLEDPVTEEQVPDLSSSLHEIREYFQQQGAYDLFDYLLKELLIHQPQDPLGHMLKCLSSEVPTGPIKVIVASAPGMGRSAYARRIARHFGLEHISAGDLLKDSGADTSNVGYHTYNDEEQAAKLVVERIQQCHDQMKGWVLDGFPRTRFQASFLKENSIAPNHVLVLQAQLDGIRRRQERILAGELEGEYIPPEKLESKLRLHSCHSEVALETYKPAIRHIDTEPGEDFAWGEIERTVRMLPRSHGPAPPPRVVILGPRGIGAREHASLLAARLGAVFVDGHSPLGKKTIKTQNVLNRSRTTMDMPNKKQLVDVDKLAEVGVRLRQPDCVKQGFVLCNFPTSPQLAQELAADPRLTPTRVVSLQVSADVCVSRLRHILTDPLTGNIWTTVPKNPELRKRLQRNPGDQPAAVQAAHEEYMKQLPGIMAVLGESKGSAIHIPADAPPQKVFTTLAEFVERPLPLPPKE